ncbi:hypothetical protein MANES_06G065350v8 [Manihot esculenta]|uniref:Uncharacterized protein n=1 Tax=Manihot esculenta TaxID=3983 RepID=A0ACB7HHY0_MANES|nr:hypothetical protein MANES_06G065350v8 [Manihot esculenta]
MAENLPLKGLGDDFSEQILTVQPDCGSGGGRGAAKVVGSTMPMMGLQLGTPDAGGLRTNNIGMMPLRLNLEHHGFLRQQKDRGGALDILIMPIIMFLHLLQLLESMQVSLFYLLFCAFE